jgi:hypothetical protein
VGLRRRLRDVTPDPLTYDVSSTPTRPHREYSTRAR